MTAKKNPTNAALLKAITDLATTLGEVKELGQATHAQATLTNGRVGRLERWRENQETSDEAIADYEKKHPPQTASRGSLSPLEVKLIAIIMALIALVGSAIAIGKLG